MSLPSGSLGRVAGLAVVAGWTLLGLDARAEGPPVTSGTKPPFRIAHLAGAGAGVAFSPSGADLAWGREDGTVQVAPVADLGKPDSARTLGVADAQFSTHRGAPGPIRFSGDGATLVAGNFAHRIDLRDPRRVGPDAIRAWDVATGRARFTVPLDGLGRRLAITRDGRTLRASVRKGAATELVQSWDLGSGAASGTLALSVKGAVATAFAGDGSALAVADAAGAVTAYEITSGQARATYPARGPSPIVDLAFAPDGRSLVVVHVDNAVEVRDDAGAARFTTARPKDDSGVFAIRPAFSPDGRTLALVGAYPIPHRPGFTAFAGRAIRLDVATGAESGSIPGMPPGCSDLALGPDGRYLAITDTEFGDGTIPTETLSVWEFRPR